MNSYYNTRNRWYSPNKNNTRYKQCFGQQWKVVSLAFRKSIFPKFSTNNNFLFLIFFCYISRFLPSTDYFQFTSVKYFNESLIQVPNNLLNLYCNIHQLQCKFALKQILWITDITGKIIFTISLLRTQVWADTFFKWVKSKSQCHSPKLTDTWGRTTDCREVKAEERWEQRFKSLVFTRMGPFCWYLVGHIPRTST